MPPPSFRVFALCVGLLIVLSLPARALDGSGRGSGLSLSRNLSQSRALDSAERGTRGSTGYRASVAKMVGTIHMDFQDVDLRQVIRFVAEVTGRNYVLNNKVQGKVSVVTPSPVTLAEVESIFDSMSLSGLMS